MFHSGSEIIAPHSGVCRPAGKRSVPLCSKLSECSVISTPSITSIYSGPSDIETYEHKFFSKHLNAWVLNESVEILYDPAIGACPKNPVRVKVYNATCIEELKDREFIIRQAAEQRRWFKITDLFKPIHSYADLHISSAQPMWTTKLSLSVNDLDFAEETYHVNSGKFLQNLVSGFPLSKEYRDKQLVEQQLSNQEVKAIPNEIVDNPPADLPVLEENVVKPKKSVFKRVRNFFRKWCCCGKFGNNDDI